MKTDLKLVVTSLALTVGATMASAATVLTFDSVDAPGDSSSWMFSCTDCDMLAFDDASNSINDGISGSLLATGDAFFPVTGNPADRDPDLAGSDKETKFLSDVAAFFGDIYVPGSFDKDETGPNYFEINVQAGDYVLWKASQYAGVARINSLSSGNMFSLTGSNGISHFSKISTTPVPLPAAGWMLLAGVGGLAAMRRRRKAA